MCRSFTLGEIETNPLLDKTKKRKPKTILKRTNIYQTRKTIFKRTNIYQTRKTIFERTNIYQTRNQLKVSVANIGTIW